MGAGLGSIRRELVSRMILDPLTFNSTLLHPPLVESQLLLSQSWAELDWNCETYTWELGAAVTALWSSTLLLEVQVSQLAAGSLDNADLVAASVVWHPPALYEYCQSCDSSSCIVFSQSIGRT